MKTDPGPLLGRGREADIYNVGDGRVLRRNRNGRDHNESAQVVQYLHDAGFPVPEVFDIDGADLVMEKIVGRTMLDSFPVKPWRIRSWARMLADLHRQLAAVALPPLDLAKPFGEGGVLMHGDLHPDNVFLTKRGPIVIDWDNVAIGPAGAEPAYTWVIMASSEVDGSAFEQRIVEMGRNTFVNAFLKASGRTEAVKWLPAAADLRLQDANVRPGEAEQIRQLVADNT